MRHDIVSSEWNLSVYGGTEYTGCVAHMITDLIRTGDHQLQLSVEELIEQLYELAYNKHPVFIRASSPSREWGSRGAIDQRACYKETL